MRENIALATIALAAASFAASAGVLANAGFEEDITGDGPPFVGSWESFSLDNDQFTGGDIAFSSEAMARSGLRSLELGITVANSFAGAFQDVDGLVAGQEWTFAGWHKSLGEPGGTEIRIEWRDSVSDTEISRTANLTPTVGSDWEQFSLTSIVPDGADTARIVYAIQSFGGPIGQSVFVDDTSFVPAPGALALLGLGGLTAARRRR
jgi:MYXO-CTERM domain-containing protein